MQHQQAISYITQKLKTELSENLTYHSISHTLEVITAAESLAKSFDLTNAEIDLLLTAAAFHDSGFLVNHQNHEEEGCKIVRSLLPKFEFSSEEIDQVCGMIIATKVPQTPKSHLEEILCDADLSYLSGTEYHKRADQLYEELNALGTQIDQTDWKLLQIKFLESHNFWTRGSLQSQGDRNKLRVLRELYDQLNS